MQLNKLTTDQLHFIDTYLKNSGVEYVDIRYEMTDHIACALEEQEGDFSERFRVYMIQNKLNLLSGNSRFKRLALRRAGSELLKTLCQPWLIGGLLVLVFTIYYFFSEADVADTAFYLKMTSMILYFTGMAKAYNKDKYSVMSYLYGVLGIIFMNLGNIISPERLTHNLWIIFTFYAALIIMGYAFSITAFRIQKQYKTRYAA